MKYAEKWQKDLEIFRNTSTCFIVEGNVHDLQPVVREDECYGAVSLLQYLHNYLVETGYERVVFYNRSDGFHNPFDSAMVNSIVAQAPTRGRNAGSASRSVTSILDATETIRSSLQDIKHPTAIVIDLANTVISSPDNLSSDEMESFTRLLLSTRNPTQANTGSKGLLKNLLFLVTEKVNDVPAWFYFNNPYVHTLTIGKPDKEVRSKVMDKRVEQLEGASSLSSDELAKAKDEFASLTEDLTLVEILGIYTLCRQKGYSADSIRDAVKLFRYGETESQWDRISVEKAKNAEVLLSKRVKGQPRAVGKAADILRRACLGLTGIQGGSNSRPKGVLFLAGPTGTGKTELAKTIAEFVFGDEGFVTRFDMSEYQQPHSDQRLLGAPPGYVGYSNGGQLTNAIKARPFSVLLFDEIDKAHPSILDKFLQILEDGRITDSSGETVYFTESIIIFTSNLGMVGQDNDTGIRYPTITPDMDYETIRTRLMEAIRNYFKYTISRPELLNRMGDNFIVFDFLRDDAAKDILTMKIDAVVKNLESEKGIHLVVEEPFRRKLMQRSIEDTSNGGRGISNMVETYLVNPLARILVQEGWKSGGIILIFDF